ncbi:MAG: permease [Deltaproteobacteria bacterium]|nr:permease [Deltaproteobacteria bacterium]
MNDILEIFFFVGRAAWHVLPFFLLSMFLSVVINMLDLNESIRRAFAKREGLSVLLATAVGAFSPFCSCTVIPIIAGLLMSGVPLAPVMSFWIASPTMDPEIFTLTVGILGWPLALSRLGASLVLSLCAGYLTLLLCRLDYFSRILPAEQEETHQLKVSPCCKAQSKTPHVQVTLPITLVAFCSANTATASAMAPLAIRIPVWWDSIVTSIRRIDWAVFARRMGSQSWRLGRWLLVAFTLEALITMHVPQETIASILGDRSTFAIPLASLIGIPLYLGNLSALPIVKALITQGMQPGAAIAFLMAGPVTTIPAMTAVWTVVRKHVFALYIGISLFGSMLLGFLVSFIL